MTAQVIGLHLGWGHAASPDSGGRVRPAFQMCLARAVTGPERFKGGTCSFGAPVVKRCWGLSRADSNGRYAVGGHIIARIVAGWQGDHPVAGLLQEED